MYSYPSYYLIGMSFLIREPMGINTTSHKSLTLKLLNQKVFCGDRMPRYDVTAALSSFS